MTSADQPPLRIGTAERTAAMKALDEHLDQGRLGVEEYADRSAVAANATVASELTALFADLPAPHPQLPGVGPALPEATALPATPSTGTVAGRTGNVLDTWGPRLVALSPVVALVLFLVFRQWWFFLLIPAMGALVYGGRDGRNRDRDRRRDRY
jgi:hypothetical protein